MILNLWKNVIHDMWYVTCYGGWTFSKNVSSLALNICDLWYFEDLEEKADWLTDSLNDEAVCRTAPATQGLLITLIKKNESTKQN